MNDDQYFEDARIRTLVNLIVDRAWHHRHDATPRDLHRAVQDVVTPFLKHPEAAHGWVRVPYKHIATLLQYADPAPVAPGDGKTYVFKNPMAAEVLTKLSAEIRSMADAMKGPMDGQ